MVEKKRRVKFDCSMPPQTIQLLDMTKSVYMIWGILVEYTLNYDAHIAVNPSMERICLMFYKNRKYHFVCVCEFY